jgi:AcrR family transcriptional regulator
MTSDTPPHRYAKGEAKRAQILAAALTVIAQHGYRNSTLQEIADAVNLTKAGVLHYFDSREHLIAEVLKERDAQDDAALAPDGADMVTILSRAIKHNSSVGGMVQLYSRVVVEAEAPEHPGHAYVRARYERVVSAFAEGIRQRQRAGTARADLDPVLVARAAIALSDGLQLQWLHDRDIDMSADFEATMALILGQP